jgi:hypothetical protein
MLGPALHVLTFVALAHARAIVTNHCPYNVYVWSVPQVLSSSHTDNVPIKPGGQYQEPWRHGSITNPGVAIKISTKSNGILEYADEIDFAYAVDGNDDSKIWVDLSAVREDAFKDNLAFHSCLTHYSTSNVQTHQCAATDDIELVLCDTSPRSTPKKDPSTLEQVKACYDYHHVLPEAQGDGLQVAADEESSSDSDTDTDTDCCESRDETLKITYSMTVTAEYTAPATSEATAEFTLAPSESSTKAVSTTTSTSRLGLFTPPSARETDCPGCERLLVLSPCLARVVYPARRRVAAVPRQTLDATTPQRGPNPSLCDIVQKYHHGIRCDEKVLEYHARELFPKICDPEYTKLLMGFPCEEIAEELKSVYPDIDGPKLTRTTCECEPDCGFCGHINETCFCADASSMAVRDNAQLLPQDLEPSLVEPSILKICLSSFCDPIVPGVSCNKIRKMLTSLLADFDERYEDWVYKVGDDECTEIAVTKEDIDDKGICIVDLLCDIFPEECDDLATILTVSFKVNFDKDVDYMTNRDTCALAGLSSGKN